MVTSNLQNCARRPFYRAVLISALESAQCVPMLCTEAIEGDAQKLRRSTLREVGSADHRSVREPPGNLNSGEGLVVEGVVCGSMSQTKGHGG